MSSPKSPPEGERDLSDIELLTEAPLAMTERLVSECNWSEYEPGDIVVDQNESSTDVYFIVSGAVRIVDYLEDDREIALAELSKGDCFGELSALDLKVRSARVTATEPTILASMTSKNFRTLLLECPGIAITLLKRLAGYVRTLTTRVSAMSSMTPQQRVYAELVRMSEPDVERDGRWVISNFPGHGEIASWVGTERDVVAEAIGQLARSGIVERKHKVLRINDHARLQRLAVQH